MSAALSDVPAYVHVRRAQPWLGTYVDIAVSHTSEAMAQQAITAAFDAIASIHGLMSAHDPDSDVARINRAAPFEPVAISRETAEVLATAAAFFKASDGLFDCAVAPALERAGYLPGYSISCKSDATFADLHLSVAQTAQKSCALRIDLGGIAKGYAVDCAINVLLAAGVLSACVNAGGDLRVFGVEETIHLRDPANPQQTARVLRLSDAALATSAGYFSRKATPTGNIAALVDPRTRCCIDFSHSVSVIAPECMVADALTKVVALSGNPEHPALQQFGAQAFIF